ncbi:AI-2E family transporter [Alteromonas mediterranea]|uniref:Transporter n=2 Tax=Alteromonas mediterranea TaxID=314275 RepID=A0AAC9ADU7_9ALTE|nr:AI-2E family transporter [Alteromonas mediterranea]AFV86743.1 transport protein [Alteromonas mediterranea DE1]AGP98756.1 transporter [Alteromonas mediterranea UM7]AGQ02957.1 transporter [Alteromonas mediterranea UM4b]AMJ79689.1 transporter [Alteromonas mediterranea]AMJ83847.1 transporter [Alteromonas mediterranea]
MDNAGSNQNKQKKNLAGAYPKIAKQTRLLNMLVVFAFIYTLYLAKSLLIPLFFSAFIALLLSPLVAFARKLFVPRTISAGALIAILVTPFTLLALELAEPAERWMHDLPKIAAEITEEIEEISKSIDAYTAPAESAPVEKESSFFDWFRDNNASEKPATQSDATNSVTDKIKQSGIDMGLTLFSSAPFLLAQILACIVLIFFLLVFGPNLFHVFIRDFPVVTNKRRALVLVDQIQRQLSSYIVTISIINTCLGLATAGAFHYLGIEDALLWGALVALMNFVPYLGGIASCLVLLVVGLVQFGLTSGAFLPAGIFLALNIMESQLITPAVLGRSMQLNPLIIIIWIAITGWLWGVVGVLLAVPILMCVKIILENLGVFNHWIRLIESK